MFSRKSTAAEHTTAQAWDYLSAAAAVAGDNARTAGQYGSRLAQRAGNRTARLADTAGSRVSSVSEEARNRANAAAQALAGRRPRRPWRLVIAAGIAGIAAGWTAAVTVRAAMTRRAENDALELAEPPSVPTPTFGS